MKPSISAVLALALACALAAPAATRAGAAGSASGGQPARVSSAASKVTLPFIHDDYTKALAQARARKVPLFIEAWAPW